MFELLEKLCLVQGTPGDEGKAASLISGLMEPYTDLRYTDALGNLICHRSGSGRGRSVMFCSHMDETGFVVTFIEENGRLRIAPVGQTDPLAAAWTKVAFGGGLCGILAPDPGTKQSDFRFENFGVDVGARTRAEAEKLVKPGDRCVIAGGLFRLAGESLVAGKPLCNRAGCAALIEIARKLASRGDTDDEVWFVFSVQGEVGQRGAGSAAYAVRPDLSLTVETAPAGEITGTGKKSPVPGDGAGILVRDDSVISDPGLVDELSAAAREREVRFFYDLRTSGASDAKAVQSSGTGVKSAALTIPVSNSRTGAEIADLRDIEAAAELAAAFVR